jgi:ATP-dependent Clp protease ATP-binding subunit ClpA
MVMPSFQIDQPSLVEADAEARQLGHTFIAPEHLFLAAVGSATGPGRAFCARHGLSREVVRTAIRELVGPAPMTAAVPTGPLTLALRTQVALAKAVAQGLRRGDPRFTLDELLMALCDDAVASRGVIGAILERAGVSPASARAELASLATDADTT